jgi:molybdenum cofactor cytidylyltransferase
VNSPLRERLDLGAHELVAFVGGGGKSTLMLSLGRELADVGTAVVVTTTTRMASDQVPDWATTCRSIDEVEAALGVGDPAFLMRSVSANKVIGVAPDLIDALFARTEATLLVEADGANRLSFKAPGPGEPLVPSCATLVAIIAGTDAIGRPIGEACHRPERVTALTGRSADEALRAEDVARVLSHPDGGLKGVPEGARVVALLTRLGPNAAELVSTIRSLVGDRVRVLGVR